MTESPYDFGLEDEMDYFDPELIAGFFHRLEFILEKCPIDIYVASSNAHPWPFRLQHVGEANAAAFHSSPTRILDSEIKAPEIENETILARAAELDASYVVAKDYLPFDEYDGMDLTDDQRAIVEALRETYTDNVEATTESIREFASLYDPDIHPPAFVPLQPPYDVHYREVEDIVEESDLDPRFMLGGLKGGAAREHIDELEAFRFVAGKDVYAHGLGWGLPPEMTHYIRDNPWALDSVDNSTPCQGYRNGKLVDKNWRTISYDHVTGTWATAIGGLAEMLQLGSIAHRMTPYSNDRDYQQSGLDSFHPTVAADGGGD